MKKDKYAAQQSPGEPQVTGVGPYDRQGPIKVSFGVYFISLILVALIIFIVMLVQYFPGYRSYYRLCLLYTSDAADDLLCVDLGGRRIIKKKKTNNTI